MRQEPFSPLDLFPGIERVESPILFTTRIRNEVHV